MALFLLTRKDDVGYDEAVGFVVRAAHASAARRAVAAADTVAEGEDPQEGPGGEGASAWLDSQRSTCNRIPDDGPTEIILRDFNAG